MTRRVDYPAQVYSIGSHGDLANVAEKLELETNEPSPEEVAVAHEMEAKMLAALDGRENRVFLNMLRGATEAEMAAIEEVSIRHIRRIVAEVRRKAAAAIGRVQ